EILRRADRERAEHDDDQREFGVQVHQRMASVLFRRVSQKKKRETPRSWKGKGTLLESRNREGRRLGEHVREMLAQLLRIIRGAVDDAAGLVQRMLRPDAEPDRVQHDWRGVAEQHGTDRALLALA